VDLAPLRHRARTRAALPGPRASFDRLTGRLGQLPASWEREKGWGKETTGLPDLLVFPGVWYTVATDRAAAERLCTEGFC
jgi:hypothetical protein